MSPGYLIGPIGVMPAAVAPVGGYLLDSITPQPTLSLSTRKLRSAYAGNCMQICTDDQVTTAIIGFSSDDINQADVDSFYTTNGITSVLTWYNQSGSDNPTAPAVGGGLNSPPVMRGSIPALGGAQATVNGHTALGYYGNGGRFRLRIPAKKIGDFITASAFTVIVSGYVQEFTGFGNSPESIAAFCDGSLGYASLGAFYDRSSAGGNPVFLANIYAGGTDRTREMAITTSTYIGIAQLGGGEFKTWLNGGTPIRLTGIPNIDDINYQPVEIAPAAAFSTVYVLEVLVYNTALSVAELNTLGNGAGITMGSLASRAGVTWTTLTAT